MARPLITGGRVSFFSMTSPISQKVMVVEVPQMLIQEWIPSLRDPQWLSFPRIFFIDTETTNPSNKDR